MKPCGHLLAILPDPPGSATGCRVCFLYETEPRYRALWDGQSAVPAATAKAACRHRGLSLRTQPCPSCGGHVHVKIFACALHGECTVAKLLPGSACCQICPDFAASDGLAGEPGQEDP
jgi:hypothetical protein